MVKFLAGHEDLQVEAGGLGPAKVQAHRWEGSKAPAGTHIHQPKIPFTGTSLVVKKLPCNVEDAGLITGHKNKIPRAME